MDKFPFKDPPEEAVYICSHLLENGAELCAAYHLDTPVYAWSFLCGQKEHTKDEIAETTLGEVYEKFPETAKLAETPTDVMMKKGGESGNWYGFTVKGR